MLYLLHSIACSCDLHVQRTGTVSLHIAACGENNDRLRHVDTATIFLLTEQKIRTPINVLIILTIAAHIYTSSKHTAASLPHLTNMKLEHPVTASELFDIQMLIGADKY